MHQTEDEELIRELFEAVDLDASGYIDEDELAAVVDVNPEDLKEIFKQLDSDQDGRISIEEFMENYKHFQKLAADVDTIRNGNEPSSDKTDKIQTDSLPYDSGYSMSEPTHRKSRPPLKTEMKKKAAKYLG